MLRRAGRLLAAYPELAAVLAAAAAGLCARRPLAWLTAHQGIDALLVILVFATAVTIDPAALRRLVRSWRLVAVAVLTGITVLPALSWAVAYLVPAGPLRDGVLVTGLAPCEIASVATTALAGGEAAVAAGVLIGSTLATVTLAAPVLTLEAGRAGFSPGGVIANLTVVVALPLAAGIALRSFIPVTARLLGGDQPRRAASRLAVAAVTALVALVAAEVRLSASYGAVAVALGLFLAGSAVVGRLLGSSAPASGRLLPGPAPASGRLLPGPAPASGRLLPGPAAGHRRGAPSPRPAGAALLLTTSMRDFAIAAALAAAAFGPSAAAPLGLYGVAVLIWGTAAAGALRARAARPGPDDQAGAGRMPPP